MFLHYRNYFWILFFVLTCFIPTVAKADGNSCVYTTLAAAEQISAPLCDSSGNLKTTGSGGSGGSYPYTYTFGQTPTAASFLGVGSYNVTSGTFEPFNIAPFGGNGTGTGYPAAYGQPTLVTQGGYLGGAFLVIGNIGISQAPFTAATSQPLPGPTSTATPVPNAGFLGVGGSDYSAGAGSTFNPLKVNSSGQITTIFPSAQPVSFPSAQPVTFPSAQPVTFPSAQPVQPITFSSAQPVTFPSAQPVTFPSAQPVTMPTTPAYYQGQNGAYQAPIFDNLPAVSSTVSTATTTLVIAGSATLNTYVYGVGFYSDGTNATDNVRIESGTGATCGGSTVVWTGPIGPNASANGVYVGLFGNPGVVNLGMGPNPIAVPMVIPAAATPMNLCAVTAGTTISVHFISMSIQRAN